MKKEKRIGRLQRFGYNKWFDKTSKYVEWNNEKADTRISYDGESGMIYIRQISDRRPIAIPLVELMASLADMADVIDDIECNNEKYVA